MNWRTIENFKNIMLNACKGAKVKIDFKIALWAYIFIVSMSEALFSLQSVFKDAIKQLFPQTAKDEFLDMFGEWDNLPRKDATSAEGKINFVGSTSLSIGKNIPIGTQVQAENGVVYSTTASANIAFENNIVIFFQILGGVATVTTTNKHLLASGQPVNLIIVGYGSIDAENITVIDDYNFQFSTDIPNMTSDGTIGNYFVAVNVKADTTGSETNQDSGTSLTVVDELDTLINDIAFVLPTELKDGFDIETNEEYKSRILMIRKQMRGVFTDEQNISASLRIAGNAELIPDPPVIGFDDTPKVAGFQPIAGEAVFYLVRRDSDGNLENPVDPSILAETKEMIITFGKKPSHLPEASIYVFSPLIETLDFDLTLDNDTPKRRSDATNSIKAYIQDNQSFQRKPDINGVISAINSTPDIGTFKLNSPSEIIIPDKHIAELGTVSFS